MRVLTTIFFSTIIFILAGSSNASVVIFFENFDSQLRNWQLSSELGWKIISNDDAYEGIGKVEINGPALGQNLIKNISTGNCSNLNLSFWYKIKEDLEADDHIYIEWSAPSGWAILGEFTDISSSNWSQKYYNLPAGAHNNPNFAIRFRAELGTSDDVFYLDELIFSGDCPGDPNASAPEITPEPAPEPTPTPTSIPTLTSIPTPIPTPNPTLVPTPQIIEVILTPEPLAEPSALVEPTFEETILPEVLGATVYDKPAQRSGTLMASISGLIDLQIFWIIGFFLFCLPIFIGGKADKPRE